MKKYFEENILKPTNELCRALGIDEVKYYEHFQHQGFHKDCPECEKLEEANLNAQYDQDNQ